MMAIKSDKWIKKKCIDNDMINPFIDTQIKNLSKGKGIEMNRDQYLEHCNNKIQ